jgi:hypothetical protein
MFHISLHGLIPLLVAIGFYRKRWKGVALLLIATATNDLDHLLPNSVYDPNRCSLGFHPLHTLAAIVSRISHARLISTR